MLKEENKIILSKLKYFSFFVFLIVLPWQKRHIFSSNLIAGQFNEWTAISLYLSDIVFGIALLFWFCELLFFKKKRKKLQTVKSKLRIVSYWLLASLFLWSLLSIPQALNLNIAFYRLLRLLVAILLFIFVAQNFSSKKYRFLAYLSLIFSGLVQAVISTAQYWKQHSLGLKLLGENDLGPNLIGVAKIVISGQKIIRGYGTFPHPNVLAAFIILLLPLCFHLYGEISSSRKLSLKKEFLKNGLIIISLFFLLTLTITFSRTAWFGFAIILILFLIYIFKNSLFKNYFRLLASLLVCIIFLLIFFGPAIATRSRITDSPYSDFALSNRVLLNKLALLMISRNPLLGIGLGNFVSTIPAYLGSSLPAWRFQPVHNIYFAFASEIGLHGLLIFLGFLCLSFYLVFRMHRQNSENMVLYTIIIAYCLIGTFDHYFYDLQQGILMFWLVLGFIWSINPLQNVKHHT